MDKREIARIFSLFNENLFNAINCGISMDKSNSLAMIATVVDVLRADAKKAVKPQEETKEVPIVPLSVLRKSNPLLYTALFAIGCERLNDIMAYRNKEDNKGVIEVLIGGRFAALSKDIGIEDMMTLRGIMEGYGMPLLWRGS
jgi:hypothetical protein